MMLADEQRFAASWAAAVPDRVVVPIEEITDLESDPDGVRMVAAFRELGLPEVVALTTIRLEDEPDQAVRLDVDPVELGEWRWRMSPYDVVIAATDSSCAVLLSVDEFALVAGGPGFVESVLGKSVSDAREEFAAYAEEMAEVSRHLPGVAAEFGCA